jgi:amino acid adenylation domain-containing protein
MSPEFEPFPAAALQASICARFEQVAQRQPTHTAIADDRRTLSYGELAQEMRRIAALIAVVPGPAPVAVLMRNEARMPAALLGVIRAGRACVALDAAHPLERNARIATHSGAALVVTTRELAGMARSAFPKTVRVLDLDDGEENGVPPPVDALQPDDVAHIVYTSGSTGAPKGVFQDHRGALHDVMQAINTGRLTPADRIACIYPPAVIAGLRMLMSALLSGASLEVLAPLELGSRAMAREISARGITILRCSPTLFRHLAHALEPGTRFGTLRTLALGGERVDWSDFDLFRRSCAPEAELHVHLGATECWTLHTEWTVDPAVRTDGTSLPVGRAVADRAVMIIGPSGVPVASGEIGEAVVTSRYLARGYWREPELTVACFAAHPGDPTLRSYHTGDLVRRRADGLLEFIGRADQQIKLHGHRIEPNEVESALRACAGVRDAAVLVRRSDDGRALALVGYVQLQEDAGGLLPRHLMSMLSRNVPAYMMPAELIVLEELPWLPNFKADRQRLAELDAAHVRARANMGCNTSPLIRELIATFEQIAHVAGATPYDSLLSLGADSIQALELTVEIERRFGVTVPEGVEAATRSIEEWADDITRWSSPVAAVLEE